MSNAESALERLLDEQDAEQKQIAELQQQVEAAEQKLSVLQQETRADPSSVIARASAINAEKSDSDFQLNLYLNRQRDRLGDIADARVELQQYLQQQDQLSVRRKAQSYQELVQSDEMQAAVQLLLAAGYLNSYNWKQVIADTIGKRAPAEDEQRDAASRRGMLIEAPERPPVLARAEQLLEQARPGRWARDGWGMTQSAGPVAAGGPMAHAGSDTQAGQDSTADESAAGIGSGFGKKAFKKGLQRALGKRRDLESES